MKHKEGYVYFLYMKESNSYKIGYTSYPDQRMKTHRTSNNDFRLEYIIDKVDINYETYLHTYFKDYKIKNEWYDNYNSIIDKWIFRDKCVREVMNDKIRRR